MTAELQTCICKVLAGGNTRTDAALAAGIDLSTFCRWMRLCGGDVEEAIGAAEQHEELAEAV